jgi:hypothetical protein
MPFVLGIFSFCVLVSHQGLYSCFSCVTIDRLSSSLAEGLPAITAHVAGEQALVPAPVREPPVELSVRELLALDPFDNLVASLFTFFYAVSVFFLSSFSSHLFLSLNAEETVYSQGCYHRLGL